MGEKNSVGINDTGSASDAGQDAQVFVKLFHTETTEESVEMKS